MTPDGKIIEPVLTEYGDFYYHTYEKVMTWKKDTYHIIAKTQEEANKAMIAHFQDNELHCGSTNDNDLPLVPRWCDRGEYYEGDDETLSYEDNGNRVTEELYTGEGDLIDDNTPIQIKRDLKLYNLFLNK
jgi:hypothetical protein